MGGLRDRARLENGGLSRQALYTGHQKPMLIRHSPPGMPYCFIILRLSVDSGCVTVLFLYLIVRPGFYLCYSKLVRYFPGYFVSFCCCYHIPTFF